VGIRRGRGAQGHIESCIGVILLSRRVKNVQVQVQNWEDKIICFTHISNSKCLVFRYQSFVDKGNEVKETYSSWKHSQWHASGIGLFPIHSFGHHDTLTRSTDEKNCKNFNRKNLRLQVTYPCLRNKLKEVWPEPQIQHSTSTLSMHR
jgi:hypothetical protein